MSFDRWASTQLVPMQVTEKSPQIANQTDCHRPSRRCKQHYAQIANLHRPAMMQGESALRPNKVGITLTKLLSYPPRPTQTKYVHKQLPSLSADAIAVCTTQSDRHVVTSCVCILERIGGRGAAFWIIQKSILDGICLIASTFVRFGASDAKFWKGS